MNTEHWQHRNVCIFFLPQLCVENLSAIVSCFASGCGNKQLASPLCIMNSYPDRLKYFYIKLMGWIWGGTALVSCQRDSMDLILQFMTNKLWICLICTGIMDHRVVGLHGWSSQNDPILEDLVWDWILYFSVIKISFRQHGPQSTAL